MVLPGPSPRRDGVGHGPGELHGDSQGTSALTPRAPHLCCARGTIGIWGDAGTSPTSPGDLGKHRNKPWLTQGAEDMGMSPASLRELEQGTSAHQEVDGAAHAVGLVLVIHDSPVVQEPLQEFAHQLHKVLSRLGQLGVALAAAQQAEEDKGTWVPLHSQLCSAPTTALLSTKGQGQSLGRAGASPGIGVIPGPGMTPGAAASPEAAVSLNAYSNSWGRTRVIPRAGDRGIAWGRGGSWGRQGQAGWASRDVQGSHDGAQAPAFLLVGPFPPWHTPGQGTE